MAPSHPLRHRPAGRHARRRGSALFMTLLFTTALSALAMGAIFLTSGSNLLTRYYDRERDFRYAAEAGLGLGRSRLARDTSIHLPDSGYVTLAYRQPLRDAQGNPVPRTLVSIYAGRSGNVTGQLGTFATLVSVAEDSSCTSAGVGLSNCARYVRRLELVAENFARFAMFTNTWQGGLCYGTGEFIRGLAWSNQGWVSCGPPGPTYYDSVGAVGSVTGAATYTKGYRSGQSAIPMPTVERLSNLPGYASAGSLNFSPTPGYGFLRVEFVAKDLDDDGDSTGVNEGFIRVFEARSADYADFRVSGWSGSDYPVAPGSTVSYVDTLCGDWHGNGSTTPLFYPIAAHNDAGFGGQMNLPGDPGHNRAGVAITDSLRSRILAHGGRCFMAGDPHLAAMERATAAAGQYPLGRIKIGGSDTTFTDSSAHGRWRRYAASPAATISARYRGEAPFLFPLSTQLNPGYKGVIHVSGDAWASGQLRGAVTLYASGSVYFPDDLQYVQNPASVLCANLLGVIAGSSVMVDDNALNRPEPLFTGPAGGASAAGLAILSANQGFELNGVTMALSGTVGVNGWGSGPSFATCNGRTFSGGCLHQVGGVIEQYISPTYAGAGTGFAENRESDACMAVQSPPYFPITGRYFNNRYYEYDPARFNVGALFTRLQSGL